MFRKRIQYGVLALVAVFLLGACDQVQELTQNTDVSQIEQIEDAEFYNALRETVQEVQIPVLLIGVLNLAAGWRLRRAGLMLNGFVIGALLIYTYLNKADFVEDENLILGAAVAGGAVIGVLTFFLYNLMALVIGGAIGTTLMGGAWLQVAENVPPQLLVFVTTFISAMVMFVVFRLFLVAFSALIGAVLLMVAVPLDAVWVLPVAGVGIVIQSGVAWMLGDDIFRNLRGDLRTAVGESFSEGLGLGVFGVLRERQQADSPPHAAPESRQRSAAPQHKSAPSAPQQYGSPAAPQQYSPPAAPQQYSPPAAPQQYGSPAASQQYGSPAAPQQYASPNAPHVLPDHQSAAEQTQQHINFNPTGFQLALSDGRIFPLAGIQITVGRNADNTIVVNDAQVSGSHLVFSVQPEGVVVWDNNSTNGTLLNGAVLKGSHRLTPQDVLQIGAITLRLVTV